MYTSQLLLYLVLRTFMLVQGLMQYVVHVHCSQMLLLALTTMMMAFSKLGHLPGEQSDIKQRSRVAFHSSLQRTCCSIGLPSNTCCNACSGSH